MLSLFNWVSVWGTWMGPVMGIYPNLGLIYFFDSRMWEDCWPEGQLVWSSVVWNVRAISSSQCINKLPLTLRTLGNILPLSWVFPYKPKWEYSLSVLRVFFKYQPTCSSPWLQTAVWYSCMYKICHQLCFLFKVMSHSLWVFSQYAGSKFCFITHSSLIYSQQVSKTLLYTKTKIGKNKIIY